MMSNFWTIFVAVAAILHGAGIIAAFNALFWVRTPQAAIAWFFSLFLFPYLALPLYLVFGRARFRGYQELRVEFLKTLRQDFPELKKLYQEAVGSTPSPESLPSALALEALADRPFSRGNSVKLLNTGEETFAEILQAISSARHYVFVQFFIIRDDELGAELKVALINKAREGVPCYLLYDEIGSSALSATYLSELQAHGVRTSAFETTQGMLNKFQFNFRNHRKIVIVDGAIAFVGGNNVGQEYLGKDPLVGPWRDLHIRIDGPEAVPIQGIFLRDWYWATREGIEARWNIPKEAGIARLLTVATGPADGRDTCTFLFLEAILGAKKRFWIATPYFVPDEAILSALQLAQIRGVDVRILLPKNPDHKMVWLASFAYIPLVRSAGVRVFRYTEGFMHQKKFLVDDRWCGIGTTNLDSRSLHLNFELTVCISDSTVIAEVAQGFELDFKKSEEELRISHDEFPFWIRLSSSLARLFSPVL